MSIEEQSGLANYDEFAIGWNEIFDQDGWAPDMPRGSLLPVPASSSRGLPQAAASTTGGGLRLPAGSAHPLMPPAGVTPASSSPGPRSEAEASDQGHHNAFWSTEASKSKKKKLPEYMRIPGRGKQSAIEHGMKERLLACPTSQVRKPAQVMESELDTLRNAVSLEHSTKRREARQLRRLQRRCRVKAHEDLDELQLRYPPQACLRALPDPAEKALTPRQTMHLPSKEFFGDLRHRQRAPSPTLAHIPVTRRVGGAAPHTAR